MQVITNPKEFQHLAFGYRLAGEKTALVPTMGFLHEGHKSLMLAGKNIADKLMLSIFVNPTQFGPNEDLDAYPRDFEKDCQMAEDAGVDVIFAPKNSDMYAPNHSTWVEVPDLAKILCGASRPVHFKGVCTVVLKLFALAMPTFAMFGEKDWQQLAIIKTMTRDLNFPTEIKPCPIVREADGLALSSRNTYLAKEERVEAPHIYKGLKLAEKLVRGGERNSKKVIAEVLKYWKETLPLGKVDYLELVHPDEISRVEEITENTLMAVAVNLGRARLIDNLLLRV